MESFQDGTTIQYDYYPDGRLRSKTDKNGIQVSYEYNDQGLLTKRDFQVKIEKIV